MSDHDLGKIKATSCVTFFVTKFIFPKHHATHNDLTYLNKVLLMGVNNIEGSL